MAGVLGIDPLHYLHADGLEMTALTEVMRQMGEMQKKEREALAAEIAVAVSKLFKR